MCSQSDHSTGKPGKVREFQSGQEKVRGSEIRCVFQALNTPKLAYDAPPDSLVGWGGGYPIPFPQLLQPQLLNN